MWLAATRVRIAPLQDRLPVDRLAGGDDREAPGGGDAEGGHGLADDVLAEHRPEGGLPVAAAGEPRPPRPLELDVDEPAGRRPVLAQQDGAAVAEHGEAAVLVPGVGLGDRPGAGRQVLAGEQGRGGLRRERARSRPSSSASRWFRIDTRGSGTAAGLAGVKRSSGSRE